MYKNMYYTYNNYNFISFHSPKKEVKQNKFQFSSMVFLLQVDLHNWRDTTFRSSELDQMSD